MQFGLLIVKKININGDIKWKFFWLLFILIFLILSNQIASNLYFLKEKHIANEISLKILNNKILKDYYHILNHNILKIYLAKS